MRYSYSISYVPGKSLYTADTLSRAPVAGANLQDQHFQQDIQHYVDLVVNSTPASQAKLEEIKSEQDRDEVCKQVKEFCQTKWPKKNIKGPLNAFLKVKSELSVNNGILLRGKRLVIPPTMRQEMLSKNHSGHQGINKCLQRAKCSVWWPGIRAEIQQSVSKCLICCKTRLQPAEPLLPTSFPIFPWQKVATDLFDGKGITYLLVVDYYSRFIEIAKLSTTTSSDVIRHLKSIFAHHGIPEVVISDNGPQYSSS